MKLKLDKTYTKILYRHIRELLRQNVGCIWEHCTYLRIRSIVYLRKATTVLVVSWNIRLYVGLGHLLYDIQQCHTITYITDILVFILGFEKIFWPHNKNSRIYFPPVSLQTPLHFMSFSHTSSTGRCGGQIQFLIFNAIPRYSNLLHLQTIHHIPTFLQIWLL